MRQHKNVRHTKPIELLGLLISTFLIFVLTSITTNYLFNITTLSFVLSILLSVLSFLFFKKKLVKISNFNLTSNRLEWNNNIVDFDKIKSYKIHWMKGAGLKLILTDGNIKKLSSNSHFCNSDKFVKLTKELDNILVKYNNGKIQRKKSFMETKYGFYYVISFTLIFITSFIYSFINGKEVNSKNLGLVTVGLTTLWAGLNLKK
tara:strand:- start:180 stop:791 length:612 start_codon:yes stop_codon:yes gene_type:complete